MPNKKIFNIVVTLITIGVVFAYSLTPYLMVRYGSGEFNYVMKQAIFGIISIMLIWMISRLEAEKWLHIIGMSLFIGGLFAIIIMNFLPPSIVPTIGGAARWISIMGFSIAPVEFFKIGFTYFVSWSMSRKIIHNPKISLVQEFFMFVPYFIIFVISAMFIAVMQKDLGQSLILGTTLIVLVYLAGGSKNLILKVTFFIILGFILVILTFAHRINRIQTWWQLVKTWLPDWILQSFDISQGAEPYQISQALGAINNGGFWGVGLGNGIFKLGFLAEVHTDFVLEGIAEELGIFALFIIFTLFTMLIFRLLRLANRSQNKTYTLFNVGIALIIGLALLINTYGATGILPMKGIPVPFLSYGGSSMLALSIGIGMSLMTSKYIPDEPEENKNQRINSPVPARTPTQNIPKQNFQAPVYNQQINNNYQTYQSPHQQVQKPMPKPQYQPHQQNYNNNYYYATNKSNFYQNYPEKNYDLEIDKKEF